MRLVMEVLILRIDSIPSMKIKYEKVLQHLKEL